MEEEASDRQRKRRDRKNWLTEHQHSFKNYQRSEVVFKTIIRSMKKYYAKQYKNCGKYAKQSGQPKDFYNNNLNQYL